MAGMTRRRYDLDRSGHTGGARRSALGARRSALGARRSALLIMRIRRVKLFSHSRSNVMGPLPTDNAHVSRHSRDAVTHGTDSTQKLAEWYVLSVK